MSVIVSNDISVINVDAFELKRLQGSAKILDDGAVKIFEGLQMFVDDLMSFYDDTSDVPYEQMFNALRTVIKAGAERREVRNACLTGIIRTNKTFKKEAKAGTKQKVKRAKNARYDIEAIRKYAVDRTSREVMEKFGFPSMNCCKVYLSKNKIVHKMSKGGRPVNKEKLRKTKALAKSFTTGEIAAITMCSKEALAHYAERHNIKTLKTGRFNL